MRRLRPTASRTAVPRRLRSAVHARGGRGSARPPASRRRRAPPWRSARTRATARSPHGTRPARRPAAAAAGSRSRDVRARARPTRAGSTRRAPRPLPSLRRSAIAGRAPSSSGASSRPRWSSRPRTSNLQAAGDERPRLAVGEVVEVRPVRASDLEHVSEALGGQQRGPGAAAFRDGVDHDRRAVDEGRDVGGVDPRAPQRVERALLGVRGRVRLGERQPSAPPVDRRKVGERPADVDRHAVLVLRSERHRA